MSFVPLYTSSIFITTTDNRATRRLRGIITNALTSVSVRALSTLVTAVSIPLTIRYLGNERFGMWMTIASTVAMLGFLDLGIGQGLINLIADSDGRDDADTARSGVSSATMLLAAISIICMTIFALLYHLIPWPNVFNVTTEVAQREAGPTAAVLATCFFLSLPLSVVRQVQLGYQEGFQNDLWQVCGTGLGFAALMFTIHGRYGLPWLVLALVGAPQLSSILNCLYQFGYVRRWLAPTVRFASIKSARDLIRKGVSFTGVNVCAAICVSADNFIVARSLGAESVAQFAVPARLFGFGGVVLNMLLVPLWPAFTEAFARNDYRWLRAVMQRALLWGFVVSAVPSILILELSRPILLWWVGPQIRPNFYFCLGLAVWTIVSQVGYLFSTFLAAVHMLRFRLLTTGVMTIVTGFLKITLVSKVGLMGIPVAMTAGYIIFSLIPAAIFISRFLQRVEYQKISSDALWIYGKKNRYSAHRAFQSWMIRLSTKARRSLASLLCFRPFLRAGKRIHNRARARQHRRSSQTTRFFRNQPQLDVLLDLVKAISPRSSVRLAILGCSTGAELYSIMYVLRSGRPDIEFSVTAIDVSSEALERARSGLYAPQAPEVVNMPKQVMFELFDNSFGNLRVREDFRRGVCFRLADAGDPEFPLTLPPQDIVFANNFLVHLVPKEAEACLLNVGRLLAESGHLFVSGVDLDVKTSVMRRLRLLPIDLRMQAVHYADQMLISGWPWEYWGLEPIDTTRDDWRERYATVFRKAL